METKTNIWKFNGTTGYWVYQRSCLSKDDAEKFLLYFMRVEPNENFVIAKTKPRKSPREMALAKHPLKQWFTVIWLTETGEPDLKQHNHSFRTYGTSDVLLHDLGRAITFFPSNTHLIAVWKGEYSEWEALHDLKCKPSYYVHKDGHVEKLNTR